MKKVYFSLLTLCCAVAMQAKVVYVSPTGNNTNAGTTWSTAVKDIQAACEIATASGDEVWIAGGTYYLDDNSPVTKTVGTTTTTAYILMPNGVRFFGGFAGTETAIDQRTRPNATDEPWAFTSPTIVTVKSSSGLTDRPVDVLDKAAAGWSNTIDGLVFQDIVTTNGRIVFSSTDFTMRNCAFIRCKSTATILIVADATVENTLFEENTGATASVMVLQVRVSNVDLPGALIKGCTFRGNYGCQTFSIYNSIPSGKTWSITPGNQIVTQCRFINNRNATGQNFWISEGSKFKVYFHDNLLEGNEGFTAGTAAGGSLLSVSCIDPFAVFVTNNIIRNNKNTATQTTGYVYNGLLAINASKFANNLVYNNSSIDAIATINNGGVINNTFANNAGSFAYRGVDFSVNNIYLGNTPAANKKLILLWHSQGLTCNSNDVLNDNEINNPYTSLDIYNLKSATIDETFVNPTTFVGTTSVATELETIQNANFSLKTGSTCLDGGTISLTEIGMDIFDVSLLSPIRDTYFASDLAGVARIQNNKISIGAYQGTVSSGISDVHASSFAKMYRVDGKLAIETTTPSRVRVIAITGSEILSRPIGEGRSEISISSHKGQMVVVSVTSEQGTASFKVVL